METRASYIVVGGFVLVLLVGVLAVALWLGGTRAEVETTSYRVEFTGTVTGLQVGSRVQYRGIPVGEVTDLRIDHEGRFIRATLEVRADTPIKVDTEAVLEQQMLTGVSVVQLRGGRPESPRLEPGPDQQIAVIRAGQSSIQELTETAPELVAGLSQLVHRAQVLLSDENLDNFSGTLADVRTLTSTVANRSDALGEVLDETLMMVRSLREGMVQLSAFATDLREITTEQRDQIAPTVAQVQSAATRFSELAATLDGVVDENRRALRDFSSTGLYELTRFLTEARTLVAALQRLTERIERDPARFFFGDSQVGVPVD